MDTATGLLYVGDGQYYDPSTGRFLTRNAKPNQSNPYLPLDPTGAMLGPLGVLALVLGSKKKKSKVDVLLFVLVFAVITGMTIISCGPPPADGGGTPSPTQTQPSNPPTETQPPVPTPTSTPSVSDFVPESPNNSPCGCHVWNYPEWETIDGLSPEQWLIALQTYSHYCNTDSSEENVFWPEAGEAVLSLKLILAHNIIKEFGDILIYNNWKGFKKAQSDAYARQYWEHCGPDGCFIVDGIADSRLISFLSGSKSWRDNANGITDVILGGFGDQKKAASLALADRIIKANGDDSAWKNGEEQNQPFHYGYVSDSYEHSPKWLLNFLKSGKRGNGPYEYVESKSDGINVYFVLTPEQADNLCGNSICVRLDRNAPPPYWLNN